MAVTPGQKRVGVYEFDQPVGVSRGERAYRIRIVSDGRYVHAYPIGENE